MQWERYMKLRFRQRCRLLILPALIGMAVFYVIPFLKVIYYSFVKGQYHRRFVGLQNYLTVLKNEYFQLAVKNTLLLIVICVPAFLVASFVLSVLYFRCGRIGQGLRKLTLYPFFLPSISVVAGFALICSGMDSAGPVYLIFLWKYLGVGILIMTAALTAIDPELYQAARVDGAKQYEIHLYITLPLCLRAVCYNLIIGIVYSFRTFRESYLYYGDYYPPEYSYTLQYYMNNQFLKLNYSTMSAASMLMLLVLTAGILVGYGIAKKGRKL